MAGRVLSCLACQLGYHPKRVHLWVPRPWRWEQSWEGIMSVLRARGPLQGPELSEPGTSPDGFALSYPGIWEMLTAPRMPDGTCRQGSTLMLFYAEGQMKGCLNDRDTETVAFITASGADALFRAIELGLQADTLDWRKPKPFQGRPKKR